MFRVQFMCHDKDLGEVFKRLTNIAYNIEHQFVPNVEPNGKAGPVRTQRLTGVDALELFTKEFEKQKLKEITGSQFKALVVKIGLNPSSYSYFLQNLVQSGVLKKGKKVPSTSGVSTMTYHVAGK